MLMKWVTRKNIKVDRVACPWLIRRFVDPEAEFLFVDEGQLLNAAQAEKAIPFDAPKIPEVKLNHRGNQCSFEAIISDYNLTAPGLARLALIVRAADINGQESRRLTRRPMTYSRRSNSEAERATQFTIPHRNAFWSRFTRSTSWLRSIR